MRTFGWYLDEMKTLLASKRGRVVSPDGSLAAHHIMRQELKSCTEKELKQLCFKLTAFLMVPNLLPEETRKLVEALHDAVHDSGWDFHCEEATL